MQYLTTHDLIWINQTVTGQVQPFNYVTLEAAMAGQYSYGQSRDVPNQAAILLERLMFSSPFALGNRRTAFVSTLAFLHSNGYALQVSDVEAARAILELERGNLTPMQAIHRLAAPAEEGHSSELTLRTRIAHEFNQHTEALKALSPGD